MAIALDRPRSESTGTKTAQHRWSPRVARLHQRVQESMLRSQVTWRPESILEDAGLAALPLELRRAHAFAKTLADMPIQIADDELIVGRCTVGGVVCRTALPE